MIILKIIGIILLALLASLLLVIVLVLFVPVRYKILGELEEEITVHARVTWLLHLISWRADYQNKEFDTLLRILGIKRKDKSKSKVSFEDLEDEQYEEETTVEEGVQVEEKPDALDDTVIEENDLAEKKLLQSRVPESRGTPEESKPKESIFSKIKETILGIRKKIIRIWKMLCQTKDKVATVKELIRDEVNRRVTGMVFAELKYLLGHFKFRRIDTDLRYSLGDPANTGQALGVLAVIPFLYQYNFNIYPDFESEEMYVKGSFCIQGRVRIVHILVSAVRLIKQREFRRLMAKLLNR